MTLSEQAMSRIRQREEEEAHDAFNRGANRRKRSVYWVGFLEGALASTRIEDGELDALRAEAARFVSFFDDPDAADVLADIDAHCFSDEADMMDRVRTVAEAKREELLTARPYSDVDEMNEFLGFCAGIVCDGRILQREVEAILRRFRTSFVLLEVAPFEPLRQAVEAALADKVLTEEEAEDLREWIARIVSDGYADTGVPNIGNVAMLHEPITDPGRIDLDGARVVLTGPMRMGPRRMIEAAIADAGGIPDPRVTWKTDYVVVSSNASRHWRTTHFGTKIERARELIQQGCNVRFVSEVALEKVLRHGGWCSHPNLVLGSAMKSAFSASMIRLSVPFMSTPG